jgi:hypothetical protein
VFETNIFGATFSDAIKNKYPETFTSNNNVISMNENICGIYFNPTGLANNSTISLKYHITIPMITFNLLARIRYLLSFFGTWKIELVPTLENMIYKVITYNNFSQTSCTHVNKELAFQFYNVGTNLYYSQLVQVIQI